MPKYAWPHPLAATNYLLLSWMSSHIQKCNFIPQLICEILWLKDFCTLIGLEVFGPWAMFLQEVKRPLELSHWRKKAHLNKIFFKALKASFVGYFCPPSLSELFSKTGICHFSYLMMPNFMEKKSEEKRMIWRSCIADRWTEKQSQTYRTLKLGWVSN